MWRSWRAWCFAAVLLSHGVAPAPAARAETGAGDPSRELIVLLASGKGIPTPEAIVQTMQEEGSLPTSWGLGTPDSARFLVPAPDRQVSPDLDPESPAGLLLRYVVLSYPLPVDKGAVLESLEENGDVLFASDNRSFELSLTPNDPKFPPPVFNPTPDQYQWGSHSLHLPEAWDYNRGHSYVGVIDLGTAVQHPDLRTFHKNGSQWLFDHGSYRPQFAFDYGYPSEVGSCPGDPNPSASCVDEGQPQFVGPTVSCPQGICPVSLAGHGTHVSGIIGATANNGTGVAGACWGCSLIVSKATYLTFYQGAWANSGSSQDRSAAGISGAVSRGAQVLNLSFGYREGIPGGAPPDCQATPLDPLCVAVQLAADRDVLVVAAAGNDFSGTPDWPARDPRALGIAGIDPTGAFWNDCPGSGECGSNYSPEMINAPAKQVFSTFYPTIPYVPPTCPGGSEFGLCTGTSMAAPYIAGSAGILRSVNPLLTQANVRTLLASNVENPLGWDPAKGKGKPNVAAAVRAALGTVNGAVIPNRLTPLFSLYSSYAEDSLYTTVPQMAAVALLETAGYLPTGPAVPGYFGFPGVSCQSGVCPPWWPAASVYVFTGERAPYASAPALIPLYRMSFKGANPNGNANHRDTTYTTDDNGVLLFKAVGYELDGIEGFIHPRCTPEPACIPAGAVRLYRRYNAQRDDFAIFPESELAAMTGQGYTSSGGSLNEVLGYAYPNADGDSDDVIDGFEGLVGSNPQHNDSDCDGVHDGVELLGFPASDPLGGPGCSPPVARFSFSCSGLSCAFNGSSSTDNVGIVSYFWTFGDGGTATGVSPGRTYAATGSYVATLTVTDTNGLTSSLSKKLNVTSSAAAPAESYFSVPLCRIFDSRNTTVLVTGQPRTVQVTGSPCGIPATAKAVSVTVTAVTPTGPGFLRFLPGNLPPFPYVDLPATLNFDPAIPARANNAILRLATDGSGTLSAQASVAGSPGQVHLVVDVGGYYSEDTAPAPGAQGPYGFQDVTPCRIADTRVPTPNPLAAGASRSFTIQGTCGIPAGAPAVALNLAAVSPTVDGYVVLYPSNVATPLVSSVNLIGGPNIATANGARLPLAPTTPDVIAIFGSATGTGTTHLVLDAQGYFATAAPLRYHPITACRAADTRFADLGAPALAGGESRDFQIRGNCGIPASAKAAFVNLVAVGPTAQGFLAAYAAGTPWSGTSTVNYDPVQGTIGNGAIVPLGTGGNELSIVAGVTGVHLVLDAFGYFE